MLSAPIMSVMHGCFFFFLLLKIIFEQIKLKIRVSHTANLKISFILCHIPAFVDVPFMKVYGEWVSVD